MSRQKKTRRLTDIMPTRKSDKKPEMPKARSGKKLTRYELDAKAREEKRKRKHKGLDSGSRHSAAQNKNDNTEQTLKDPRIGSRKKVPLMVEFVNQPEKGRMIKPVPVESVKPTLSLEQELEQLENNECLNQLLDDLEAGKTLSAEDQKFMNECLDRIDELMTELGIEFEDDDADAGDALLRQFETMDINKFR